MQYFVRTLEKHKESTGVFGPELPFRGLPHAQAEARRLVQSSDPAVQLQADACVRNKGIVRTKYRCWINDHQEFHECAFV